MTEEKLTAGYPNVTLSFGDCFICGKPGADATTGAFPYHAACIKCPECGETDLIIWRHSKWPLVFRCLNCLHRWEIEKPAVGGKK